MKVYFLYVRKDIVPENVYNSIFPKVEYSTGSNDYILYGLTDEKKLLKEFLKTRRDIFIVTKRELDDNGPGGELKNMERFVLEKVKCIHNGRPVHVVMTHQEKSDVRYGWAEDLLSQEVFGCLYVFTIPCLLKKYQEALGTIGYTSMSAAMNAEDYYIIESLFYDTGTNENTGAYFFEPGDPLKVPLDLNSKLIVGPNEFAIFIHEYKWSL